MRRILRKGSRVFVDAELDWREWTDSGDKRREAVTFRARQVLFEGGRSKPADVNANQEQDGRLAASGQPVAPAGVSLPEGEGAAGPDDLPF